MLRLHDRRELVPNAVLNLDTSVASDSPPTLAVVAELENGIVILEDSYWSQPLGLSYCQAGTEQFLRILKLTAPFKQSLQVKIASCVRSLDLDDKGVVWNADVRTLEIHWLDGSHAFYRIDDEGEIENPA